MKRTMYVTAVCILTIVSAGVRANLTSPSSEIDELRNEFEEHFNEGDIDFLMSCFAPTADVVNPLGKMLRGQAEIRRDLEEIVSTRPTLTLSSSSIRFLSSNIAVDDGTSTMTSDESNEPIPGRYSVILMKTNGAWKLVCIRQVVLPNAV